VKSDFKILWTSSIHCDMGGPPILKTTSGCLATLAGEMCREMPWFVYILRCSDDSLYCGVTTDLVRRVQEHASGTGARYTRPRLPVELVWRSAPLSKSAAYKEEFRIKGLPKQEKENLVVLFTKDPSFRGLHDAAAVAVSVDHHLRGLTRKPSQTGRR
jgi:putative endonuclease